MKRAYLLTLLVCLLVLTTFPARASINQTNNLTGWKAGVARVAITPKEAVWMAGYAVRTRPAEGTLHDLWAKVLAMEDEKGKQVVLVTTDLLGFPKNVSDHIRDRLKAKFGLSKAQILLNSSHTHSGPVLQSALSDIYPLNADQLAQIARYSTTLENQIVALVGDALGRMEPVSLYAQNGVTRFQVNRRNNNESTLPRLTELKGPNDYAVPVLKVLNAKGDLKAVAFGYSCHPTVLDTYKWSGDYAGFAQLELEKAYPGVTALFFQMRVAIRIPCPAVLFRWLINMDRNWLRQWSAYWTKRCAPCRLVCPRLIQKLNSLCQNPRRKPVCRLWLTAT